MAGDPISQETSSLKTQKPKLSRLLGQLRPDPGLKSPLGGINPYHEAFDQIGQQFKQLLTGYANLTTNSKILDIGCGTGRLAKQLIGWMPKNNYHGIEINKDYHNYCKRTYKSEFSLLDINHAEFNPSGKIQPEDFKLDFPDSSFTHCCMIAVLNHFKIEWFEQYAAEISRILVHKGIFFATAILINSSSDEATKRRNKPPFLFDHREENQWWDFYQRPLFNTAISEHLVRRSLVKHGLMIKEPIRYGEWCGSQMAITGHDVIIASKGGWNVC
jgi:SAM-dependent methyltransferase